MPRTQHETAGGTGHRLSRSTSLLTAAGATALFLALADLVAHHRTMSVDINLMTAIHGYASSLLDQVMVVVTYMGSAVVLAPLEIVFLCWLLTRRKIAIAGFLAVAVGGGELLNSVLKGIFGRQRPELWDTLVSESSYSFPSGHAMHTMALFVSLAFVFRGQLASKWPILLGLTFALMVGFSRVYLGVHYPSDVLGGWLAAIGWSALCSVPLKSEQLSVFPQGKS